MSGPAIHHIVARETVAHLKHRSNDPAFKSFCDRALNEWAPYLHFGCQGPDPLLLNLRDLSPEVRRYVELYLDLVDFMEDVKARIRALIPPELLVAAAALEEAWDNVAERSVLITEISQLVAAAQNNIELLKGTMEQGAKKYLTDAVDVFDLLSSPIQDKGYAEPGKWWWFDVLHYRKTGQYAEALMRNSAPHSANRAYALGYLTHFSSDTVGHPYVNLVSGGPYRTHGQRHKFVENHHDVYAWNEHFNGEEFIQSQVGDRYIIDNDPNKLPGSLNDFIRATLKEVYTAHDLKYAAPMTRSDLDDVYRLWLKWFRGTTNALDLPKPVPYSLTQEMLEAYQQFTDNLGDISDMISDAAQGVNSIWDIITALAAAVLGAVLAAAAVLDWLAGNIATLGAAPIRFFLSLTYEYLYNAYQHFHQGVVLNGLAFPFNKQLPHFAAVHCNNPSLADATGLSARDVVSGMPFKKFTIGVAGLESHLIYPRPLSAGSTAGSERSRTTVAPKSYMKADPFWYMFGPMPVDPAFYAFVKDFQESSGTPVDLAEVEAKFRLLAKRGVNGGLGSAVQFAAHLHAEVEGGRHLPDMNLDGDRGYGFQAWRRVRRAHHFNDPGRQHVAVEDRLAVSDHQVLNTQTDIIHPNNDIL
jgi:hypothetical protein